MRFTTPKMSSFRDLEQKWALKVEALLGNTGGWEKRRRLREREGELLKFLLAEWGERTVFGFKKGFSFSIILFKLCHMSPFEWSKKGPLSLLIVTHTQPQKVRKIWPFETLKSCLSLRAVSLVFESNQYIYQNAQNKTPSVVQRLVSLNSKLHAKRWFLN